MKESNLLVCSALPISPTNHRSSATTDSCDVLTPMISIKVVFWAIKRRRLTVYSGRPFHHTPQPALPCAVKRLGINPFGLQTGCPVPRGRTPDETYVHPDRVLRNDDAAASPGCETRYSSGYQRSVQDLLRSCLMALPPTCLAH